MTLTIDEFCFLRDEVYGINDDPKQVRKRLEEYQENQFKKAYNLCSDIYPSTVAKSLDKVFWENGQPYKFGNQYLPKPDDVLLAFEDEASLT